MSETPARILLATSRSASARHATTVAAELASALAAHLTIVHVVPAIEYRVGRLAPTLPITRRLDDPYASAVLLDARRIAWDNGAAARTVLIAGEVPQAIVALATQLHVDLLVIGETRRRGPVRLLSGSGRWIHTHAPCPVLAVPADRVSGAPAPTEPMPVFSSSAHEIPACSCCHTGGCGCCGAFGGSVLVLEVHEP